MKNFILLLFFSFFFKTDVSAQIHVYKNLVMEGGGVKGFAYAGALEVLDSLQILHQIERVGGTSVGAIQATLFAIGYTPQEMMKIAATIPLKDFNDGHVAGGLSRMKKRFGFYKGQKLTEWIEKLIVAKTGNSNITFGELHDLRATKNYKDLYITGTDLTNRTSKVFSYETYPNMLVKDALRISFSIPLYYEPIFIDDAGAVQKDSKNKKYHLMVDGGLLSNYPVQIFDSTKYIVSDSSISNITKFNTQTLGLLLAKPEELGHTNEGGNYPLEINSLKDYISAVYQTIIDKPNPDLPSLQRTITISHLNLSGRVRKLPKATIQKLMESGREGVRRFFSSAEFSMK